MARERIVSNTAIMLMRLRTTGNIDTEVIGLRTNSENSTGFMIITNIDFDADDVLRENGSTGMSHVSEYPKRREHGHLRRRMLMRDAATSTCAT